MWMPPFLVSLRIRSQKTNSALRLFRIRSLISGIIIHVSEALTTFLILRPIKE